MKHLLAWFKKQFNTPGRFRLFLLAALLCTAPMALGWEILLLLLITTFQHWRGTMDEDRPGIMATTAILSVISCAISELWCHFFGWIFVVCVLIYTLCWQPLCEAPEWFRKRQARAKAPPLPDYAKDAIDVEWWDCSDTCTEKTDYDHAAITQKRLSGTR